MRRKKPFGLQPRRRQKLAFIDVKNRICRAAPILGGKFTTHDYMHGENGWIDACFLGHKAPVFYNLSIQTAIYAYREAVQDVAWDRSYVLAPEREPLFENAVVDPKTGNRSYSRREPVEYPELGGMTRFDWINAQLPAIADSGEVSVFEDWSIHRDYVWGVGLHVTLDVPAITIPVMNDFIDRFLATESDYRDPSPGSWRYDQVAHWGLESNAIVEPWDWAKVERATTPNPDKGTGGAD